jgi:exodeoxyribonuclease VII small subunit
MRRPPKTFEDALRDLEGIVERLESGDLSLEQALGAFEEGVALVRHLGDTLTAVEKRIEVLTRDQSGEFQLQEVTEEDEEDK